MARRGPDLRSLVLRALDSAPEMVTGNIHPAVLGATGCPPRSRPRVCATSAPALPPYDRYDLDPARLARLTGEIDVLTRAQSLLDDGGELDEEQRRALALTVDAAPA